MMARMQVEYDCKILSDDDIPDMYPSEVVTSWRQLPPQLGDRNPPRLQPLAASKPAAPTDLQTVSTGVRTLDKVVGKEWRTDSHGQVARWRFSSGGNGRGPGAMMTITAQDGYAGVSQEELRAAAYLEHQV